MTTPFTTYPAPAQSSTATPDPADLWDYLVSKGLSGKDATAHVLRVIANSPENVRRDYLKDVDPGALASFGLGAADMMSFGLGDQFARKLEGQEATDTQQAAGTLHPTSHLLGEIAGVVGPAGVEYGLAKAGMLAPSAVGKLVSQIANKPARAVAKTALRAAEGAGYAGAQAAGRTEGDLSTRLEAAKHVAPIGAVAGAVLPWAIGAGVVGKRLAGKLTGPATDFVAGEAPAVAPKLVRPMHIAGGVLDDIAQAAADRQAGLLSEEGYNTAMEAAGRQAAPAPTPARLPPPLTPIPGNPRGLLGPEGLSPPPKASYPPTLSEMQGFRTTGRPGHPIWEGEGAPSRSAAPPTPAQPVVGTDEAIAAAKKLPFAQLRASLENPSTPKALRQIIRIELKRRGIVYSG